MSNDQRFEELISRVVDDEPSQDELLEMASLLKDRPDRQDELRSQFEAAQMIYQSMDDLGGSALFLATIQSRREEDPFVDSVRSVLRSEQTGQSSGLRGRGTKIATVVSALAVSILTIVFLLKIGDASCIATIKGVNGEIHWTGDGGHVQMHLTEGQQLFGGTFNSMAADSWVEFEFQDGSSVVLIGQSSLTIAQRDDQKELYLRRGDISAKVNPQPKGKPMLIQTPTAQLEVLGTQFNLGAELSSTMLAVNEGKVRATRLADGKVTDVSADHQVVAYARRTPTFTAESRPRSIYAWQTKLPASITYGEWDRETGSVSALPMLFRKDKQEPILLHVAATSVSRPNQSLVELLPGSKFRVRGSMDSAKDLLVGLTTQHLKGGFAGKHIAFRRANSFSSHGGEFELEIGIDEFCPERPEHPKSSVGLGLYDWWCLTINDAVGLKIASVELIPPVRE